MLDLDDKIEKAKRHYCRQDPMHDIPSNASYYDEESDLIVLVNSNGILDKYKFVGEDGVKQVEYDPSWNE